MVLDDVILYQLIHSKVHSLKGNCVLVLGKDCSFILLHQIVKASILKKCTLGKKSFSFQFNLFKIKSRL